MVNTLDNNILDAVVITWHGEEYQLVDIRIPNPDDPSQRILRNVLQIPRWIDAQRISRYIASREGFSSDSASFRYPNPDAPEVTAFTHFEGVYVFDAGQVPLLLPEDGFDRVIARLMQRLIHGAQQTNDPALEADWWPEFVANATVIIERSANY